MGFITPAPFLAWLIAGTIVGGTSSLIIMPTTGDRKVDSRIATLLEVESSSSDALSIVLTMVVVDLLVTGGVSLSRPLLALTRELGVGVGVGAVGASVLLPAVPALRNNPHAYTAFLAAMLLVYGIASQFDGSGAMAVLTAALLLGNASSLVPRLIPGADAQAFVTDQSARVAQGQMSFFIKSFFFVLIGLMFPTSLRLTLLGAAPVLLLVVARIPAVRLAALGLGLSKKQFWLLTVAVPGDWRQASSRPDHCRTRSVSASRSSLPGGPHQGVALPFRVWFGPDEGVAKLLFAEEVLQHALADTSSVQGRDVIGQDVPITRPHRVLQARAHLRLFEVVVEVPGPQRPQAVTAFGLGGMRFSLDSCATRPGCRARKGLSPPPRPCDHGPTRLA